jgi:hypothetical protein
LAYGNYIRSGYYGKKDLRRIFPSRSSLSSPTVKLRYIMGGEDKASSTKVIRRFSFEDISKAAMVLGTLLAIGQIGTSWISGYWQTQSELVKARKEINLAELRDRSALAESYVKLILNKETSEPDRIMLLGALSQLEGYPLQKSAKDRYDLAIYHTTITPNHPIAWPTSDQ